MGLARSGRSADPGGGTGCRPPSQRSSRCPSSTWAERWSHGCAHRFAPRPCMSSTWTRHRLKYRTGSALTRPMRVGFRPASPPAVTISSSPTQSSSTSAATRSGCASPTPCTGLPTGIGYRRPTGISRSSHTGSFPGFQFLPLAVRAEVARRWPLASLRSSSHEDGLRGALGVELLSRSEMAFYFPASALRFERMMSLIKSMIAVKP